MPPPQIFQPYVNSPRQQAARWSTDPAAAVKAGGAGSALRAGVEGGGRDTFTYCMAEKLHGSPPPLAAAKAASLILVAERSGSDGSSGIGEVIGTLNAGPPGGLSRVASTSCRTCLQSSVARS